MNNISEKMFNSKLYRKFKFNTLYDGSEEHDNIIKNFDKLVDDYSIEEYYYYTEIPKFLHKYFKNIDRDEILIFKDKNKNYIMLSSSNLNGWNKLQNSVIPNKDTYIKYIDRDFYFCPCGGHFSTKSGFNSHLKSKMHKSYEGEI